VTDHLGHVLAKTKGPAKQLRGTFRQFSSLMAYGTKQLGSPSPADEIVGFVVFTPIPQVAPASWLCVTVADQ